MVFSIDSFDTIINLKEKWPGFNDARTKRSRPYGQTYPGRD